MDEGMWVDPGTSTPQGVIGSPVLANVYLHYVFDLWTRKFWHARKAGGDRFGVRYADDFVVGFQHGRDAEQYLADLKARLAKFGLEVHPTQTRQVEFGRFAASNRKKRGLGKPETFDSLGMTSYCAKTRNGYFRVGRKPARKRVAKTLRRIKDTLRTRWHKNKHENARWPGRVVNEWLNYYTVPGSGRYLSAFVHGVNRRFLRALRRRSHTDRTSWAEVDRLVALYWPKIWIRHPWPSQRLVV